VDWSSLRFDDTHIGETMWRSTLRLGPDGAGSWVGETAAFGPLSLPPTAHVLNYGQSIFEGLKAYRTARGRVALFRPDANAARMTQGARRMMMPPVPEELFLDAVCKTVEANADLVPPKGAGSLYLRPLLIGSGSVLGVKPATEYTFLVYAVAVGPYFKGGKMAPIHLKVAEGTHRAVSGGTGSTKCAGNYASGLAHTVAAQGAGFNDVVYLDAATGEHLEEVSACNVFSVKGRRIHTPPLSGTILPGVTRDSVLQLARARGYEVEESPLHVHTALESDEVFTSGTAVVVAPVASLTYQGKRTEFNGGQPGPVAQEMYRALADIQQEEAEDPFGWVHPVC